MKEWISVEERLPKIEVDVLGFVAKVGSSDMPRRKLGVRILRRAEINESDGWCDPIITDSWFASEKCVTHWMPLPSPPQE